ncbi:MAG: META domain-containing protein [Xanthomonadales bacterium]|nr:META domain-containing protein [Xanthomonadales bacterium]
MKLLFAKVFATTSLAPVNLAFAGAGFAATTTLEDLKNATYTGIEAQPVTLSGGRWEGSPHVEGGASRPTVGLMVTMMSCPEELMRAEREYLEALSEVNSFSFHSGRLALNAKAAENGLYTMLFERLENGAP